jgi:3-oxo-5-alpha-steroid 4-dehydrogenase 1
MLTPGRKVMHYAYRAVIFPWIQPSMSPMHVAVALFALSFQLLNATCLGGWLAAYGPTTAAEWRAQLAPFPVLQRSGTTAVAKHYEVPQAGLFKYMLYPHYLAEWVEWAGFWMACGWSCVPARTFLVNEITAMVPRAVRGKKWYIDKFGEEKVRRKWAVIPGVW